MEGAEQKDNRAEKLGRGECDLGLRRSRQKNLCREGRGGFARAEAGGAGLGIGHLHGLGLHQMSQESHPLTAGGTEVGRSVIWRQYPAVAWTGMGHGQGGGPATAQHTVQEGALPQWQWEGGASWAGL